MLHFKPYLISICFIAQITLSSDFASSYHIKHQIHGVLLSKKFQPSIFSLFLRVGSNLLLVSIFHADFQQQEQIAVADEEKTRTAGVTQQVTGNSAGEQRRL